MEVTVVATAGAVNPQASTEEAPEGRVAEVDAARESPAMAAKAVVGAPMAGRALVSKGPRKGEQGEGVNRGEGEMVGFCDGTLVTVGKRVPAMDSRGVDVDSFEAMGVGEAL